MTLQTVSEEEKKGVGENSNGGFDSTNQLWHYRPQAEEKRDRDRDKQGYKEGEVGDKTTATTEAGTNALNKMIPNCQRKKQAHAYEKPGAKMNQSYQ